MNTAAPAEAGATQIVATTRSFRPKTTAPVPHRPALGAYADRAARHRAASRWFMDRSLAEHRARCGVLAEITRVHGALAQGRAFTLVADDLRVVANVLDAMAARLAEEES